MLLYTNIQLYVHDQGGVTGENKFIGEFKVKDHMEFTSEQLRRVIEGHFNVALILDLHVLRVCTSSLANTLIESLEILYTGK